MKRNKFALWGIRLLSVAFWLTLWEILAVAVDLPFAVPHVADTFSALFSLLVTSAFWGTVAHSLLRILLGLALGIVLAVLLALLSFISRFFSEMLRPAMTFIRSTPVASFILILWVIVGRNTVPAAIAVLMVLPVVYQNVLAGMRSLDRKQAEVLQVFHVPTNKRFRVFVLPALSEYFFPALITSAGLAWKAGIAAEIIAYTKNSIGRAICDAKNDFRGADMFAWTLCVILLSLLIETFLQYVGKKVRRRGSVSS